MWTLRYSPRATQGMYSIPRGTAAYVTAAIQALTRNPTPPGYEVVEGAENTFRVGEQGYVIEYEIIQREQVIKVLYIGL